MVIDVERLKREMAEEAKQLENFTSHSLGYPAFILRQALEYITILETKLQKDS